MFAVPPSSISISRKPARGQTSGNCGLGILLVWGETNAPKQLRVIFLFFPSIRHSSYIAQGTSTIFSTTSMTSKCALAPILDFINLLAVPTPSSRHNFCAQYPPTFLSLLYCIPRLTLRLSPPPFFPLHRLNPVVRYPMSRLCRFPLLASCSLQSSPRLQACLG
jgi:hypothetical protein